MPTPSTNPKRLQVIDRIVTVLKTVAAGSTYWYIPFAVLKRSITLEELRGYPTYVVLPADGGTYEFLQDQEFDEEFYVTVTGIVRDMADIDTYLEKCISDVRRAVNTDSINTASGSLGTLANDVWIDSPPMFDYFGEIAMFEQRFKIKISGTYTEI